MRQNSNQTKHLPTLLVQQIRLQWYKDCRGGNAAAQRNQYPRAMRLPKDFFSYYPFGLPTHFACRKTSSPIILLVCLLTLHLSYRGPMDFRSIGTVVG